ncbi:ORF6N domain-containing protein [bacterium]|nr:ORF6N domain-containing protein [bacterium]
MAAKKSTTTTAPTATFDAKEAIISVRGQRVIIDADLAKLYGTKTKRLNEQVKRNKDRFPEDFMFQLTDEEKTEVVANCDHLKNIKYSNSLPYSFTEHGAVMAATGFSDNEEELQAIRYAIQQLMLPSDPKKKRPMGFRPK